MPSNIQSFNSIKPIIDNKIKTNLAKEKMWGIKNSREAKEISREIVKKHASLKRN